MDSESPVHQSSKGLDLSQNLSHHFDGVADAQLNSPKHEPSLAPITPETNKENGDFPLTMVKKLAKVQSFNSKINRSDDTLTSLDDCSSPCTPKDGVFDPFAPGREEMVLAPMCKKFFDEARASVARRLDFCSSFKSSRSASYGDDVESLSDEEMFESVYENLLEAIVCNQTEGALAEVSNFEWDSDACQTPPPSAPLLSGLADTCPGAPLKPTGKSRIIDLGSCRKLDF